MCASTPGGGGSREEARKQSSTGVYNGGECEGNNREERHRSGPRRRKTDGEHKQTRQK